MSSRYGEEGGRLKGGGREASIWWRDVHSLCKEEWFSDHVSRSVGNGKHTLFWSDVWLGEVSFTVRFRRLFYLSVFKGGSVFDMWQLGCLRVRRIWCGVLMLLLHYVTLQVDKDDRWL
jgi:hypothetical protein